MCDTLIRVTAKGYATNSSNVRNLGKLQIARNETGLCNQLYYRNKLEINFSQWQR